jgi:1,3-beta-galactosyl-N-acetylhexosamine phosphorylase
VTARRAILRKPVDRIGYGGYLKLALGFPAFVDYIAEVADEFRLLYDNLQGATPHCFGTVAVLNCWGKMRSWGCHMVHHALYQKQNYSYAGIIEALSGAPWDVRFLSFDDIRENPGVLGEIDVLINVGDADTAHGGGANWADETILCAVRAFIADGGGFIGVGEPSAHQRQGRLFQLGAALGVELERGFTLGYDKYNWEERPHFIIEDAANRDAINFGEGKKGIYAFEGTDVIVQREKEVQLAANGYGEGRCVYLSGLPYSFDNARLLHRALLWACRREDKLRTWFSENPNTEAHAYPQNGKYCVINNTDEAQSTTLYDGDGHGQSMQLAGGEIKWFATRK